MMHIAIEAKNDSFKYYHRKSFDERPSKFDIISIVMQLASMKVIRPLKLLLVADFQDHACTTCEKKLQLIGQGGQAWSFIPHYG